MEKQLEKIVTELNKINSNFEKMIVDLKNSSKNLKGNKESYLFNFSPSSTQEDKVKFINEKMKEFNVFLSDGKVMSKENVMIFETENLIEIIKWLK